MILPVDVECLRQSLSIVAEIDGKVYPTGTNSLSVAYEIVFKFTNKAFVFS